MKVYHINFLFLLSDEEFIREIYRTILGREPDDEGWQNYYSCLKLGGQRYDILYQISESEEAKKLNRSVPGLTEFKSDYRKKRFGRFKKLYKYRSKFYSMLFGPDGMDVRHIFRGKNQELQPSKHSLSNITTKSESSDNQISFIMQAIKGIQESTKDIYLRLDRLDSDEKPVNCNHNIDIDSLIERFSIDSKLRFGCNISSLMQKEGQDFLEQAYSVILRRELDDGGREYFMSILDQGATKLDVLNMLVQTDEASRKPNRIEQIEERVIFLSSAVQGLLSSLKNNGGKK